MIAAIGAWLLRMRCPFPVGVEEAGKSDAMLRTGASGQLYRCQFGFQQGELLSKTVFTMPVVEMQALKMAVFLDRDGGEIIEEDRFATEITELDSFDAHMPSFLAGLLSGTRCCAESVAVPPYLRPF
jgi:hypothetical protein